MLSVLPLSALNLQVHQTVGSSTSFSMTNVQKLTFSGGNLVVNKKDASNTSFSLSGMGFFNFSDIATSIVPFSSKKMIWIFPNPVCDVINIELSMLNATSASLELVTLDGKVVLRRLLSNLTNSISVSTLPKGLYLCRVQNGIETSMTKFIKQ